MKKIFSNLFCFSCLILIIASCITALDKYTINTVLNDKSVINISTDNKAEINTIFDKVEELGVSITVYDTIVENGRNVYTVYTTDSTIKSLNGWFTCRNVKNIDFNDTQFSSIKAFYVDSTFTEQVLNTLQSSNINVSSDFVSYNFISIIELYKLFSIVIIMLVIAQFIKIVNFEKRKLKNNFIASFTSIISIIILELASLYIINKSLNFYTIIWIVIFNLIYLIILIVTNLIFCKIPPLQNFSKDWKILSFHSVSLIILLLIIAASFLGTTAITLTKQSLTTFDNNKKMGHFSNYITFQVSASKENIDNNNITHYIDSMYDLYNSFGEVFTPIIIDSSNYNIQQNGESVFPEQSGIYVNKNYVDCFQIVSKSVSDKIQIDKTNILINKNNDNLIEQDNYASEDNVIYFDEKLNLKVFDSLSSIEENPKIIVLPEKKLRDYIFNYFSNSQIFIELTKENDLETAKNIIKNSELSNVINIIEIDNSVKQASFEITRYLMFYITQLLTILMAILVLFNLQKDIYLKYGEKKLILLLYRVTYIITAIVLIIVMRSIWFSVILIFLLLVNLDLLSRASYKKKRNCIE